MWRERGFRQHPLSPMFNLFVLGMVKELEGARNEDR